MAFHRLLRRSRDVVTQTSSSEGYALWAPLYPPCAHNALMAVEEAVVGAMLRGLSPGRALDVGTGTGRNRALLERAGASLIVGVDLSAAMLAQHVPARSLVRADACRLPFVDRAFDVVSSSLMAGDIADIARLMAEAARVLTAKGHLIYSDFHPSWAERGWRRTFHAANGRTYELPFHRHTIDQHLEALEAAGLRVETIREPCLPAGDAPVLAVFHASRRTP